MSFEKLGDIRVSQLGITGNIYTHLCDDLDILTIDKRTFIGAKWWFIRVPVLEDYTGRKDVDVMQCEVWNYEW
ncbi:MAG: hypothetical protein PUB12_10325 [[Clostridium] aminophilum]|uniref:hypothetical protein n=1 Tax=[Clostridium] aminophilum TaxID=1526 RepID=UPI0026ECA093|nr:hypothetical protein [[Clostridium] aminophilum]MDD6197263.1 hypothetical protein [[Clostridium] aminophilum]